jgi:hypothetical protein
MLPAFAIAWIVRLAVNGPVAAGFSWRALAQPAGSGVIVALGTLAYAALYWHWASMPPYGSGEVRRLLSIEHDSIRLWVLTCNLKAIGICVAYSGIVLPAGAALLLLLNRQVVPPLRGKLAYLSAEFCGFLLLYVFNVLPAFHFTRYTIFLWPIGLLLAAFGLVRIWERVRERWGDKPAAAVVGVFLAAQLGVFAGETMLRAAFLHLSFPPTIGDLPTSHFDRSEETNRLLRDLDSSASPPVVVALQEVQLRHRLDERVVVRSLDGVTDASLMGYICDGYIDHDGYLIDQRVDFLLAFPNYNRDSQDWSLQRLQKLASGETVSRPGILYTKLASGAVHITRLLSHAAERAHQPCAQDSQRSH